MFSIPFTTIRRLLNMQVFIYATAMLFWCCLLTSKAFGQAICLDEVYDPAYDNREDTICYGVNTDYGNDLVSQLTSRRRRNSEFKLVQGAMDRNGVTHPHKQWGGACYAFAHQAVVEYLGYARKEQGAHMNMAVEDFAQSPYWSGPVDKDVGYWGSPEYLTIDYLNSPESPAGTWDAHDSFYDDYWYDCIDADKTWECTAGTWWPDNGVPEYAECDSDPLNHYWRGFRYAHQGYGVSWIDYLNGSAMVGCNDARNVKDPEFLPEEDNIDYLRAMVQAFVDNNIPLPMYVGETHWVTLMGYADIVEDGLPSTFFASDPA